jgi:hypothetical protein
VGVDFCAAIFEEVAKGLEGSSGSGRVFLSDGLSGGDEGGALLAGVLVEDEDGEDVAEEHAEGDERDAAEHVEAAGAHGGERLGDNGQVVSVPSLTGLGFVSCLPSAYALG